VKVEGPEVDRRLEQFKRAAKTAGVKLTHQRLEIFREVASSLEHPDADTIFRAVQARMPTVSVDTVYRTLRMLNDLGLITTLGTRRESMRFDANLGHHHHYICVLCGLARDFESAELNALRIPDVAKVFGSVVATHVEVRGICGRCATKHARKSAPRNPIRSRGQHRRKP
jgi:Fur family peroxide stress response transcriptional regulator